MTLLRETSSKKRKKI